MLHKKHSLGLAALAAAATSAILCAADWPMPAGGPQRNGWAKSERLIDKSNVGHLELLYKFQAPNATRGLNSLTPPIVDGNLITYLGFKEMLIFGGSSDKVFSVDADLNKLIWASDLPLQDHPPAQTSAACPGGLTAPVVMAGNSSASMHFTAQASHTPAAVGVRRSPYYPPLSQTIYPLTPTTLTELEAVYSVSSDGYLHVLNSSTGQDLLPPMQFLPSHANVTSLNIQDNTVYATTAGNCDGYRNALYSLDLLSNPKKVSSFSLEKGGFAGSGGTAIGNDGTVYAQVMYSPASDGHYRDTIIQLTAKDLQLKDYFTPNDKTNDESAANNPGITPLVFSLRGRDVIVAGAANGHIYLLDSKSLGGADHHTPLFASDRVAHPDKKHAGHGFRGTFSSWLDVATGSRWFYAPVFGPPAGGSIVALRLPLESEKPTLESAWQSENIEFPASPVIANGMVFVLSTGESPRLARSNGIPYTVAERQQLATDAKLIVLDAATGKELYSSGKAVTASSHASGLAVANGRVYFTTQDNNVYCFGFSKEQTQLSEH